jgi:hypothetical protein
VAEGCPWCTDRVFESGTTVSPGRPGIGGPGPRRHSRPCGCPARMAARPVCSRLTPLPAWLPLQVASKQQRLAAENSAAAVEGRRRRGMLAQLPALVNLLRCAEPRR